MSKVAHQTGTYPGFCSLEGLGVFLFLPELDAGPLQGPCIKFAGTQLYTWVKRGTTTVKCLVDEYNTMYPARARTRTVGMRLWSIIGLIPE